MKHFIFLLSLLFLACNTTVNNQKEEEQTVYLLIRHAEKDLSNPAERDPALTDQGKERAKEWAKIFKEYDIDFVYSTDYIRTRETAKPTAENENLEVILYNPKTIYDESFKEKTKGKTILLVGHSNSTPSLVNTIIGKEKYPSIHESVYNNLFKISITNSVVNDTLLKY
ncbi:SixA phosphatase family protein [Aquimarina brevivitae]|uniref:Phosphohistidine phosphatase SixA n=1 Tax=Aquimarina brevivitae TaxID=323412 RepID=A0A4Q7NZ32_9FLAO|nr:phosphoglycerate mutase family protein [Aquimarina brevivitae]RZS92584.1 phosphohistidine phosphatase SixA [Aquimarina brevivitae]